MCVPNGPLFFSAARYMIGPLFSTKSILMTLFFRIPMWKAPFFSDTLVYAHNFRTEIFEAVYSLGITWIDCDIYLTTSNKWVQIIKGQYMNRSTFWMIKYMNGSVFSKARYTNGVGFEILARTPVQKLPQSLPLSPARNRGSYKNTCAPSELRSAWADAQADQRIRCFPEESWLLRQCPEMTLIRLRACTGLYESSHGEHAIVRNAVSCRVI